MTITLSSTRSSMALATRGVCLTLTLSLEVVSGSCQYRHKWYIAKNRLFGLHFRCRKYMCIFNYFLANVNSRSRSLLCYRRSVCRLSVCRLSVVCNVRAPYSGGWNFWQCFYAVWYRGHFGALRATYDDHLRLIGKRVVDFLLVLIELFFDRYYTAAALRAKSLISLQLGPIDPNFQVERVASTNHSFFQKTRPKWSFVWYKNLNISFVRFVTMHARVSQTYRRADGQTDTFLIASPCWHFMQRGKTICTVKNTSERSLIAKLLLYSRKSWSLNVMLMPNFLAEARYMRSENSQNASKMSTDRQNICNM